MTERGVIICAGCGLAGHAKNRCPDRRILRIPAFVDTDPIPFELSVLAEDLLLEAAS